MKNTMLNHVQLVIGTLCCILFFLITSCDTQHEQVLPKEPSLEESCIDITKTPLEFTGKSLFSVYSLKHKYFIADPAWMFLEVKATLTHVKGKNYILQTREYFPGTPEDDGAYRTVNFETKITKGGFVYTAWPFEWEEGYDEQGDPIVLEGSVVEQMMLHTGYVFRGLGVEKGTTVYLGKFDGNHLKMTTNLMAKQVKPGIFPIYEEEVEGPINMKVTFDLYLDQVPLTNIN